MGSACPISQMTESFQLSRPIIWIVALLAVSGCAGPKQYGGDPGIELTGRNALPAPARADIVAQSRPYLVGPFDKLSIDVFGIEELSREVQTDASGRISFPLVGTLEASGKTPDELARLIEEKLRGQYVRDPQVTVNLEETVSQVITVDGQVRDPGVYPVVGNMTLLRAVATAKGTSEFAELEDVVVFRTVGGQRMAGLFDLKAIRQGNYPDPEIYAGDVVVVGDSEARRLFRDALQIVPAVFTPLIYLLTRQ